MNLAPKLQLQTDQTSKRKRQTWKKKKKLNNITKAYSLKTPPYYFNTSCVIFCVGDLRVYETKLLSNCFNLVNLIANWCMVKKNWSSNYACQSHASGEPNAYFIVSRWYVQVTIAANWILHKLAPLCFNFANFNLKIMHGQDYDWLLKNIYKLDIAQNLQTSHDIHNHLKFWTLN